MYIHSYGDEYIYVRKWQFILFSRYGSSHWWNSLKTEADTKQASGAHMEIETKQEDSQ